MSETYTVRITKQTTVEKMMKGDWTVVRTEKEAAASAGLGGEGGVYGYAPDRVRTVTETTELYSQTVDNLDVAGLVRFINA